MRRHAVNTVKPQHMWQDKYAAKLRSFLLDTLSQVGRLRQFCSLRYMSWLAPIIMTPLA